MTTPFWLSSDQTLLFTSSDTYFGTASRKYQGVLALNGSWVLSMSHSDSAQEAVVFAVGSGTPLNYPAVYKRYTGPLLYFANDVSLPMIGGLPSYGLAIFHAADDGHIMLLQTGTSAVNGAGAQYFLVQR